MGLDWHFRRKFPLITSRIKDLSLLVNIFSHFQLYGGTPNLPDLYICKITAHNFRELSLSPSLILCQYLAALEAGPREARIRVGGGGGEGRRVKCLKDYLHTSDIINGILVSGPGASR